LSGHSRDENFRRWTGKRFYRVVLGNPITLVAETIGCARQLDRVTAEASAGVQARRDRRLIEDESFIAPFPFRPPVDVEHLINFCKWLEGSIHALF